MKKYKLTQLYPGGPKTLGLEIKENGMFWQSNFSTENIEHFHIHKSQFNPEKFPNHWEEITKTYEILEICFEDGKLCSYEIYGGGIYNSKEDFIKWFLGSGCNYKIYSIKRLSDREIFTLGDFCENGIIKEFKQINKGCDLSAVYDEGHDYISDLKHKEKPLFITEDGVEIYSNYIPYVCHKKSLKIIYDGSDKNPYFLENFKPVPEYVYFSCLEAMEHYILFHEKRLSLNDLLECWGSDASISSILFQKFKQKAIQNGKY